MARQNSRPSNGVTAGLDPVVHADAPDHRLRAAYFSGTISE
jgi:hypothetical protein